MRTDSIEEPTVMRNDNSTTCKIFQTLFECTQSIDIDIIGRLVEQQHVSFFLQCHSQMQTIPLSTRKHTTKFFLVGSGEIEARKVCTRIDIATSHTDQVITTGDHLINTLVRIDILMLLVYISHFHSLPYFKLTFIDCFQSHDQTEKSCFTGTIRTDNSHNTIWRKHKVQIVKQ